MRFSEVAARLNGVSTPIFGVSWTPPTSDVATARRVIAFLEDRRVLYNPYEAEVPEQCIDSVGDIRRFLTDVLGNGGIAAELAGPLRAMRGACRKFTDTLGVDPNRAHLYRTDFGVPSLHDFVFNQALGELRGVVGLHVAQLSVRYGVDVENDLASILPAADAT
jgi:hypothetical protein